jgi:hypothetical protein
MLPSGYRGRSRQSSKRRTHESHVEGVTSDIIIFVPDHFTGIHLLRDLRRPLVEFPNGVDG